MSSCANPGANNQGSNSELPQLSPSDIFSYYKLSRYNRLIDSIIGDIFQNYVSEMGWTVRDLQNLSNLKRIYNGVKAYMTGMLIDYANQQNQWQNLSNAAAIDLDTIIENFDIFAREHLIYSEIFDTKPEDLNEDTPDDDNASQEAQDESERTDAAGDELDPEVEEGSPENEQGKNWERPGNEESQVDLSSNAIRTLFRLVSKAQYNPFTKKGELVYDKDGLPQPADFMKTWNLLAERLAGTKDYGDFISILTSDRTKQVVPEVDQIINMLKVEKPDQLKSYSEVLQFIQFWQIFSKPRINLQSSLLGRPEGGKQDNIYILYDEILGNRQKLSIMFNNNFESNKIPDDYKKYVKRSPTGVYFLMKLGDTDNYIPPMDGSFESQIKFLNFLGFQFSFLHLLDSKEMDNFKETVAVSSQRLYNSLKKRLDVKDTQIKVPIKELASSFSKGIPGETKAVRDLIEWESQYSQVAPTHSSRNANGELQYLINNDSALSIATYHLNRSKTLDDLYNTPPFRNAKYNPLFRSSWLVNFLFDQNGNKREGRTADLTLLSGFKLQDYGRVVTQLERNLSERNKIIQDFNMYLLNGRTDVMRTETSRSFFSVGAYQAGDSVHILNVKGFAGKTFTKYSGFSSQILKYLNGEIARIQSYSKKKQENPSLPDSYKNFSIFSEIGDDLKNELSKSTPLEINSPLFQKFLSEYGRVLERELVAFKGLLARNNITPTTLFSRQLIDTGESHDAMYRTFIAGTIIQSIEFSILYAGDPLYYETSKGTSEMAKRLKGLASTGSVAADLALLRTYFDTDAEKAYQERYSLSSALGAKKRDNTETYLTQTLKEPISEKNSYTTSTIVSNMRKSWNMRDGRSASDEEIKNLIKEGSSIKVADGQGWINLDFYREVGIRFGFLTPEMETSLKFEGLVFKRDIAGKELSPDENRELQRLGNLIYSNPDQYALPVVKGTYWGPIVNTTVDGKAYDKFAVAPIMPSYAKKHPELKALLMTMVQGGYGYVKYESGGKGFKTTPVSSLDNVTPDKYATQLFKEQIKTKNKQSTEATWLTQEVKLAFTNLFSGGVGVSERVQQLYNKYLDAFHKIKKEQRQRLGKDLGIKIGENENEFEVVDPLKFSNKLKKQAKGDSDLLRALSINPSTGTFFTPLDASGFQKEINQLVAGIIDKTLRRFKFAGGDFVMVSNHLQKGLRWYQFNPNGQTRPMDLRLTLTKEYSKLLNKIHPEDKERIGTLSRLNKLLTDEQWRKENEKALTVMFGRAPVDGPHSTGVGVIVEFLPPTMGNVIIAPEEVILQGSFDFDYDKQRVMTPYLDEKGNYLTSSPEERMADIIEKILDLQEIYPELEKLRSIEKGNVRAGEVIEENAGQFINTLFGTDTKKEMFLANREASALVEDFFDLMNNVSALKDNKIMEMITEATLLPEMYAELVSPNTTVHIRDIALRNGETTKSSIELPRLGRNMYYSEQLKIFKTFFDSKNLLAAFAYDNAFQQLLTYAGINMNEVYNTQRVFWEPWIPTRINNLLLSDDEHAKIVKDGKILSSLRDDLEGYAKQRWNSEGLNATVDAAKDPFVVLLKILLQNIGVVNVLKHMGVPFERIVHFVSNPTLQYYFKLRESGRTQKDALEKLNRDRLFLRWKSTEEKAIDEDDLVLFSTNSKEQLRLLGRLDHDQDFKIVTKQGGPVIQITSNVYPDGYQIPRILSFLDKKEKIPTTDKTNARNFTKDTDVINLNSIVNYDRITPERFEWLARPENDRMLVKEDSKRKPEAMGIYSDELRILAHFLALEKVAYAMRDFRNYFNFDTRKTSTLTDVNTKANLKAKILTQNLFDKDAIERMEKNTIHGAYMNDDIIKAVFRKIFPFLGNPTVINTFSILSNEYDSTFAIRNKRDARSLPFILNNDFIASVLFNYGEIDGKNLFDKGYSLLIGSNKRETMADKLEKFRAQPFYRQVRAAYPILDLFITNREMFQYSNDPSGMPTSFLLENIQFIKNPQETPTEREGIREQFRDMYYNYFGDGDKELKEFLKDLFVTGLVQSGFNKSFLSYSEYIPYDFKQPLIYNAMKKMGQLSGIQLSSYMQAFANQFRYNNPRYFPNLFFFTESGKRRKLKNDNKYWRKFKYYRQINPPTPPASNEKVGVEPPSGTTPTVTAPSQQNIVTSQKKVKIISGGQTGVDRLGLEVARELGLQTGGMAPKGYKTETGNDLSLKEFGLTEHTSSTYTGRTERNVVESDGTILFGDMKSAGSKQTIGFLEKHKKPYIMNPSAEQIAQFIADKSVVNIAGNRGSKLKQEQVESFKATLKKGLTLTSETSVSNDLSNVDNTDSQLDAGGQNLDLNCE